MVRSPMRFVTFGAAALSLALTVSAATAGEAGSPAIFDMDTVSHQPAEFTNAEGQKVPAGTAESVEGKFGKAVKFTFTEGARGGWMMGRVRGDTAAWDRAAGFSFWVKGDGSKSWGGIELIDKDDFGLRYAYCFPIDSTEWRKVVVRWSDLTPELAAPVVGAKVGFAPSRFGNLWFGKWFYWRDYPAHSYTIDHVALEPTIDPPAGGKAAGPAQAGLSRVRAKLGRREPVTVVTMGDSLSDERHWANREVLWSKLLAKGLKEKYGSDVTLINPAVGGSTLSQNSVLIPRWVQEAPSPDLVVVWFGGNDWDTGVRGERFAEYLRLAVDRIRSQTGGAADVLLLTTAPAHERWETTRELEQAVLDVAKEEKTAVIDVATEFRKAGSADEALKQGYWVSDKVHLGPKGHTVVSDAVMKAIEVSK